MIIKVSYYDGDPASIYYDDTKLYRLTNDGGAEVTWVSPGTFADPVRELLQEEVELLPFVDEDKVEDLPMNEEIATEEEIYR